jgi:hypothetical protein
MFVPLVAVSLLAPPAVGGLLTWSWQGALTAFFWASLVRVALLHHVTWSINSICHVNGQRPFKAHAADRAANFWQSGSPRCASYDDVPARRAVHLRGAGMLPAAAYSARPASAGCLREPRTSSTTP